MKTLLLTRKNDFNRKDYSKKTVLESDYSTLITEPCKMIDKDTGNIIGVYLVMPKTPTSLLQSLFKIKYGKNKRIQGLVTHSKVFGYHPREKIRHDFCSSHLLAKEMPKEHEIICNFAKTITKYYKDNCKEIFNEHLEKARDILPEWTIKDTPFSSGIVNKNNALNYHLDSGNFKDVYSNMIAFKSNIGGGHLSIPEYDIGLEIANNSILLFDGQKIMHGVTPIKLMSPNAYRYTVVYYTLKQMWKCEPIKKELKRIKSTRTGLEKKRYQRLTGEIPNVI